VTYNIDCSDQGIVAPNAGFSTVIQAIGNHHLAGRAQPVDVLALQELDGIQPAPQGNSATLPYIVSGLNSIYGAGVYVFDPTTDPTDGALTGNGPSGLVYNSQTIQVIAAHPIGVAPSGSGAPRQPMRYQLRPVGYGAGADFYLYVSHYKASSGSSNETRRNDEATEIRQDADALGPAAHVIYAGDFNLTGGSSEPAYRTLIAAGNGMAHDPADSTQSWSNTSAWRAIQSESSTSLSARYDFQLVSGAVLSQQGLQLAPDSVDGFPSPYAYTVFGNNGTTAYGGSTSTGANTSLNDLSNGTQVLAYLTTVTDHLPVVADYVVVLPSCGSADFNCDGAIGTDADIQSFFECLSGTCPGAPCQSSADFNGDGSMGTDADIEAFFRVLAGGPC
jgi:endonuclease/exonuclease/phosphatase family metal-dependent hydrolase